MKNLFIILFVLISCEKNTKNLSIDMSPKIVFDGSNLIDKNRNDSIICNLKKEAPLSKMYNYNKSFDLKTFLANNQNDLQIKEVKYFEDKIGITTCNCGFDGILKNKRNDVYLISFKNVPSKVGITEYSFDNEKDLLNAYKVFYNYSDFSRNLSRDKYEFLCCELPEDKFYYTAVRGNKLFLIDDSSNFSFDIPNNNIQKQIEKDKNIKMDDIYSILKE